MLTLTIDAQKKIIGGKYKAIIEKKEGRRRWKVTEIFDDLDAAWDWIESNTNYEDHGYIKKI